MIQADDGNFYGTTNNNTGCGTIFRISPSGMFTALYSFSGPDGDHPSNSSGGLIQGGDGNFYGVTNRGGVYGAGTLFSLKLSPSNPISISVHGVSAGGLLKKSSDDTDLPLTVAPSEAVLKTDQPSLTGGLVADGVTPLLVELDFNPSPTQLTTFRISTKVTRGTLATGALDQYLRVLQHSDNSSQFSVGNSVIVSGSHPNGFAYICGINSEDLQFAPNTKELDVELSATQDGSSTVAATVHFRIRRPPIVLVHGYNSDNGTWYRTGTLVPNDFLSALSAATHVSRNLSTRSPRRAES